MNTFLQREQSHIRQLRQRETTIDIRQLFNEAIEFLNNSSNDRNDALQILTQMSNDLAGFPTLEYFDHPEVINHQFFVLLSGTFHMLFMKILFTSLTKEEEQCFDGISLFIHHLCSHRNHVITCFFTGTSEGTYEKIFLTDSLLDKVMRLLRTDICENEHEPFDIRYKVLDRLIHLFTRLYYVNNQSIVDAIIQCLKSDICIRLYRNTRFHQSTVTPKQSFFMYQCPKFIAICPDDNLNEIIGLMRDPIIKYSVIICVKYLPMVFNEEEEKLDEDEGLKMRVVAWYLEFLNHFALIPDARICFKEKKYADKCILDLALSIVQNEFLRKNIASHVESLDGDAALISYALTLLYNLTYEKTILERLRKENLMKICEKLSHVQDQTIQFASQTLYTILTEDHIDHIQNPTAIARSYLYIIENTIDDVTLTYHGIKLDGVLTNLESIVQNDEVKEEITNDEEGIPLIARCVYQPNLDEMTIQRPALRIIDAISFASDLAVQQIKENDLLMEYIKELEKKTPMPEVKRLLWKTEEKDLIHRQENRQKRPVTSRKPVFDEKKAVYQYVPGDYHFHLNEQDSLEKFDLMISYCYEDREIVKRLHQRLMESSSYRISFIKDNSYALNPRAMAEAVERSTIVVMCFSGQYRNSYACRLEAEYVEKRKRPIIPVKLTDYDPTGWLETAIGLRIPIDYSRESNRAYERIVEEINDEYEKINNN